LPSSGAAWQIQIAEWRQLAYPQWSWMSAGEHVAALNALAVYQSRQCSARALAAASRVARAMAAEGWMLVAAVRRQPQEDSRATSTSQQTAIIEQVGGLLSHCFHLCARRVADLDANCHAQWHSLVTLPYPLQFGRADGLCQHATVDMWVKSEQWKLPQMAKDW
jgi:hypothetical protein